MTAPPVRYRPHHLLCSLGFQGKGYSPGFVANMTAIVDGRLRAPGGDAVVIEITGGTDDICGPCPRRRGTLCEAQDQIATIDARHARALGLFAGTRLSWGEARRRMLKRVPPGALTELCAGCQWLELGLCERALTALHRAAGRPAQPPGREA